MISITEPFNFSSHLRQIVGSQLKSYGYKMKGTSFLRIHNGREEKIYYQRSRNNIPGYPYMFYLILSTHRLSDKRGSEVRIEFPSKMKMPEFYKSYLELPEGERRFDTYFTPEQQKSVTDFTQSLFWRYSSEDELIEILKISLNSIMGKGFEYLRKIEELIGKL